MDILVRVYNNISTGIFRMRMLQTVCEYRQFVDGYAIYMYPNQGLR